MIGTVSPAGLGSLTKSIPLWLIIDFLSMKHMVCAVGGLLTLNKCAEKKLVHTSKTSLSLRSSDAQEYQKIERKGGSQEDSSSNTNKGVGTSNPYTVFFD